MYNLFVSGDSNDWTGEPWVIEIGRCVREYTDAGLTKRYGKLDATAVRELQRLPCIFAYESRNKKPPKFGMIREVTKRQDKVRVEYEVKPIDPFMSAEDLSSLAFALDVSEWELNRTHWAVKDVNLAKELKAIGIKLPNWARDSARAVDITTHKFEVALSFPGEVRAEVERVAYELERLIGPDSYFYDGKYVSQLARPALDVLLQEIFGKRSKLVVVFLCRDYQRKNWCGVEFRAIRETMMDRNHKKIMFVRMDDGAVDGVFKTDGYIDGRKFSAQEIARFIQERVELLA